jgi:hypothetical protein
MRFYMSMLAGLAAFGIMVAPAMAQVSQEVQVEVRVENYAALTITDGLIILHLEDADDWFSGLNDGAQGKTAELLLQANYRTNLVVTSGSGILVTHHNFNMVETTLDADNKLGAWPQITGGVVSGQSLFSWNSGDQSAVMDSLHREQGNNTAYNASGDDTGVNTGIPAGTHVINVGVAGRLSNTTDGTLAAPGIYEGELIVTVIGH